MEIYLPKFMEKYLPVTTQRLDTIRKPYAREQVTVPRSTSFCGTTNKEEFLNDDTGFRRWWVIPITKKIEVGKFTEKDNLHQFWSQCYAMNEADTNCFRLTDQEKDVLEAANKEVTELIPSEDELRLRMDFDASEETWHWTQSSALKLLPEYDVTSYSAMQIGKALAVIAKDFPEMKKRKVHGIVKWWIPPAKRMTNQFRESIE